MEFYKVLKEIMESKDLSIPEVARLCNLSDSTVRSIITRKQKTVALNIAFKLSDGLRVPLEVLNGSEIIEAIKTTHQLDEDTRNGKITWHEATPEEVLQMSVDSANYLRNDTISKYDSLNAVSYTHLLFFLLFQPAFRQAQDDVFHTDCLFLF